MKKIKLTINNKRHTKKSRSISKVKKFPYDKIKHGNCNSKKQEIIPCFTKPN
jgi:hypothetical protein